VAKAWNWRQLLDALVDNTSVKFIRVLSWHFAGGFLGAILPSSASTDAARAWLGQNGLGGHGAACAASVVTLNGLSWFAGCAIGIVGLMSLGIDYGYLPGWFDTAGLLFVAIFITLPVGYLFLCRGRGRVMELLNRDAGKLNAPFKIVRKFVDALLVLQRAHVRISRFLVVALLALLAQSVMYAVTAAAVGINLPFAVWMVVAPLTRLVAFIPVSIADFGLIQAAHIALLVPFGVPPWQAFALSALFALEGLFIHLTVGSVSFVYGARRFAPQPP
jgi:uncharacterized membrane protein YbhN (UPF0104 family)